MKKGIPKGGHYTLLRWGVRDIRTGYTTFVKATSLKRLQKNLGPRRSREVTITRVKAGRASRPRALPQLPLTDRCPRCGGNLYIEENWQSCLQCGYDREIIRRR